MGCAELIELPTGDWVDPFVITDIQYGEAFKSGGGEERIIVQTSTNRCYLINFGSDRDAAKAYQKDLGKALNAIRRGT